MSVLVTGGCGYVGTKLTEALLSRTDHAVTVLDTQWFGNHLAPDPRLSCAGAQKGEPRDSTSTSAVRLIRASRDGR